MGRRTTRFRVDDAAAARVRRDVRRRGAGRAALGVREDDIRAHGTARAAGVVRRAIRVRADARRARAVDRAVPDARLLDFEAYVFTTDRAAPLIRRPHIRGCSRPRSAYPKTLRRAAPADRWALSREASVVTPEQARSIAEPARRQAWAAELDSHRDRVVRRRDLARARRRHVGVRRRRHHGSGGLTRAHRIRSAPVQRRHAASCVRKARRASERSRRHARRALRRVGAERRSR